MAMLVLIGAALGPERAAAQGQRGVHAEWALRGVVISDAGRSAVLEHVPSGRDALVKEGAELSPRVAVVTIDPDRVVLTGEGDTTITLRLGHGGGRGVVRPVPPARRVPPPRVGRRVR